MNNMSLLISTHITYASSFLLFDLNDSLKWCKMRGKWFGVKLNLPEVWYNSYLLVSHNFLKVTLKLSFTEYYSKFMFNLETNLSTIRNLRL